MKLHLPEHEEEFLNAVYCEMRDFSGQDINFVSNICDIAESDDDVYELLSKWFQSQNTQQRMYYEAQMASTLLLYKLL